jgi:hypothetical protein
MTMPNTDEAFSPPPAYASQLRRQIGWICHVVRWAAVGYALWVLWMVVLFWSDAGLVMRVFQHRTLGMALTEPSLMQRMSGLAVSFANWLLMAAAVYAVWRLMAEYLAGRIFQPAAAVWLRRIGLFGLAALIFDIVARPLTAMIVSAHMPDGQRFTNIFFQPPDLLNAMFLLAFVALAQIFKSAAELADDHARIV